MTKRKTKVAQDDYVDVTEQLEEQRMLEAAADKLEALIDAEQAQADAARAAETPDERFVRRIKEAQAKLGELKLRPMVLQLLEAACQNVAQSNGAGMPDEDARAEIQDRAALFAVCDGDLSAVLRTLADTLDSTSVPGQAYAACYAVQKAANFIGNMKYRAALATDEDRRAEGVMRGDEVGQSFDDAHRDAPPGLGADGEEPLDFGNVTEHADTTLRKDQEVLEAFEELHVYLQLLPEAFGWDADAPMPYLYVANKDGTFAPVWGAEHALDIMEIRSKESRARRAKRRSEGLRAALAGAKAALLRANRRAA